MAVAPYAASSAGAAVEHQRWDPGIQAIAKEVEHLRGLRFLHPVPVSYVPPEAFDRKLAPKQAKLTKLLRVAITRYASQLRALGFVTGTVDPAAFIATGSVHTVAFYSDTAKRIFIRGHHIGVVTSVILAHELTHALQDQHFHLLKLRRSAFDYDAAEVLRGLIEGDANYIQYRYVQGLSRSDQGTYAASFRSGRRALPDAVAGLRGLPSLRQTYFDASYALGEQMVALVRSAEGGSGAVNVLFRYPPQSTSSYLNPLELLTFPRATDVRAPHLHAGEVADGQSGRLDPLTLYLSLAVRIDPADALTAIDGLGDNLAISFRRKHVECTRIALAGRSARATSVLDRAYSRWATAMPPTAATVVSSSTQVTLTFCDPGAKATMPSRNAFAALNVVTGRNVEVGTAVSRGSSPRVAKCVGDRIAHTPTFRLTASVVNQGTRPDELLTIALQYQVSALVATCTVATRLKTALG